MKIILVTSSITYVPSNYNVVLENIIKKNSGHIAGIVLVRIKRTMILKKIVLLFFSGCYRLASTLLKNVISDIFLKKDRMIKNRGLPIYKTDDINDPACIAWIKTIKPDLIVNQRARCILKEIILSIPKHGCINVHHGILPKYRGVFSDMRDLAYEREKGFSVHIMNQDIDSGNILLVKKVIYFKDKNYISYLKEASRIESVVLADFLHELTSVGFVPVGDKNICDIPIFNKNPDFQEVRKMKKKGLLL